MRPVLVRTQEESAMPMLPFGEDVPNFGAEPRHVSSDVVNINRTPSGSYRQDWRAYNAAQVNEKAKFQLLLRELCKGIEEPVQTFGRPRLSFADMIFAAAFKVYCTSPMRRFMCDLHEAYLKGYITRLPRYGSVFHYLEMEALTPILYQLIEESSLSLSPIERIFAADSSGMGTQRHMSWLHAKYTNPHLVEKTKWIKIHVMCGVKTNIVTAVKASEGTAGDSPFFEELVERTAHNFVIDEVLADKAYSSEKNLKLVLMRAAQPYIPFRSNATAHNRRSGAVWRRMLALFLYDQERFMQHYHMRSNVETTFSMMKTKFGDVLRSRTYASQTNEALCKVLCHNICVLIQSMYELGIEPTFWTD
jgi:hypothetical protein